MKEADDVFKTEQTIHLSLEVSSCVKEIHDLEVLYMDFTEIIKEGT